MNASIGSTSRLTRFLAALGCCSLAVVVLGALLLIALSLFTVANPLAGASVPAKRLNPMHGSYDGVAWIGRSLVVQFNYDSLWRFDLDGNNLEKIEPPAYTGCERKSASSPSRLSDGRLAYVLECLGNLDSIDACLKMPFSDLEAVRSCLESGSARSYLLALGPNGTTERLLNYPYPDSLGTTKSYSWSPSIDRGIGTTDTFPTPNPYYTTFTNFEKLVWLFPDRREPVDVSLELAMYPRWSPNGRQIALFGAHSEEAKGKLAGDVPMGLYLMDAETLQLRELLRDLRNPSDLAWSPDGKWLALYATFGSLPFSERGLYLVDSSTGFKKRVTGEYSCALAWSPDGTHIAAIGFPPSSEYDSAPPCNALYLFDVGQLR